VRHYRGEGRTCGHTILGSEETSTDAQGRWRTPSTHELVFETFLGDGGAWYRAPCERYDLTQHSDVPALLRGRESHEPATRGRELELTAEGESLGPGYVRFLTGLVWSSDQLIAAYFGPVLLFKPDMPQLGLRLVAQPGIWGGAVALGLRGSVGLIQWDASARLLRSWRPDHEQTRLGSELGIEIIILRLACGFMTPIHRKPGDPDYVVLGSIGLAILI
jgi:hypothetical protein